MSLGLVLDSARELTLGAASTASRLIESTPPDHAEARRLLASDADRDRIAGLRVVLSLAGQGKDATVFFADVVRSIYSTNPTVRSMAAQYLVLYAAHEPELTLMSISAIQKWLSDPSEAVRAQALWVLGSVQAPGIAQIVLMAVKELSNDRSIGVSIECIMALEKSYNNDPTLSVEALNGIKGYLQDNTRDPRVRGRALVAIENSFPGRLDVLHGHFANCCGDLQYYDEWAQIYAVKILMRYARHYFAGPNSEGSMQLVMGCRPLLISHNDAVLVQAAVAIINCGQLTEEVAGALASLEFSEFALTAIQGACVLCPSYFAPFHKRFWPRPGDPLPICLLKYRIWGLIKSVQGLTTEDLDEIEFSVKAMQESRECVRAAFEALVVGASDSSKVIRWLLKIVGSPNYHAIVTSEAVLILSCMVIEEPLRPVLLSKLSTLAERQEIPADARAAALWLIGEYCRNCPGLAVELLRRIVPKLARQAPELRLQIILLAAKAFTLHAEGLADFDSRLPQYFRHALFLGQFDADPDIRDRSRMFSALLEDDGTHPQLAALVLQASKPPPTLIPRTSEFPLDSASAILGHPLDGYMPLEPWGNRGVSEFPGEESKEIENGRDFREPLTGKVKKMSLEEFLQPGEDEQGNGSEEESEEDGVAESSSSEEGDSEGSESNSEISNSEN